MGTTRRQSGFTIVELIVVIPVIAILAAIIIVSYGAWQRSIQATAVKSDLNTVAALMETERNASGSTGYPTAAPDFTPSENVLIDFSPLQQSDEYCIDGESSLDSSIQYYIYSRTKEQGPLEGTCATRPDLTPPDAPGSVGVSSNDSVTATVSWMSVADATSYTAQCATDSAFIYNPRQITVAAGSGVIDGVVTGLTASGSPFCRVKAINSKGSSAWSLTATNTGINDGLIAHWRLNGNAANAVGTADGTVSAATLTTGQNGNANSAYSFNGTSSYITIAQNAYSNPMTVSVWYKATNATTADGILVYGNVSTGNGYGGEAEFHLGQASADYRAYLNAGGCISSSMALGTVPDTGWHLITYVVGPGSSYAAYIDGVSSVSGSYGCTPDFSGYQNTFLIGRPTSASRFLDGAVDDVRIYNRALTPSEVGNLYSLGAE
jgi:prepilin-type N-terminal cleavage/methylation domain-containing protein